LHHFLCFLEGSYAALSNDWSVRNVYSGVESIDGEQIDESDQSEDEVQNGDDE
jgi:hypothetical protein